MKDFLKFQTPGEIVKNYPILKKANWTANAIGYLYKMQLIDGFKRYGHAIVDPADVLRLFYFRFPQYYKV